MPDTIHTSRPTAPPLPPRPPASPARVPLEPLIRQHLDMVYSSALRQVKDPHLAEDVTQAVFLILAKKAASIRTPGAIGGWLLSVTRRTAIDALRQRSKDRRHERALARPETTGGDPMPTDWPQLAPVLDAALDALPHRDRDLVVLRILQNQSFAQTGAALRISEDAARMRLNRALEKLRKLLAARGISARSASLSTTLAANALHPAPAHLFTATLATATSGTASVAVGTLAKATLSAMTLATAKLIAAIVAVCLLLTIAIAAPLVHRRPAPEAAVPDDPTKPLKEWQNAHATLIRLAVLFHELPADREGIAGLKSDRAGNLYAIVSTSPESSGGLSEKRQGEQAWQTLLSLAGNMTFKDVALSPAGDLYVLRSDFYLYKRPANQAEFSPISLRTTELLKQSGTGELNCMTIDASGNVFVAGRYRNALMVFKQSQGAGNFAVADQFVADPTYLPHLRQSDNEPENVVLIDNPPSYANSPNSIVSVDSGPSAGIYIAGCCIIGAGISDGKPAYAAHWIVRKSADGGRSWKTVDDFVPPSSHLQPGTALAECVDRNGNIYVAGGYGKRAMIRKSIGGEPGSWSTVDEVESGAFSSIAAGPDGYIYASGVVHDDLDIAENIGHALLRTNASGSWQTFDDFRPPNIGSSINCLAWDLDGRLFAGGMIMGSLNRAVVFTTPRDLAHLTPSPPQGATLPH